MTDERIVNDLSDTKAPQHAVPQPQLGILPEVPKHQGACCPTPPVNPSSQTVSKPLGIQTQMVLGDTPSEVGPVPRLNTRLTPQDRWGSLKVRLGLGRNQYTVEPGLYAVGQPDEQAPVLVTANYKLSLDALRQELAHLDAWILVLDTDGVNVWCAAGKGTFATEELIHRLNVSRLAQVVTHRRLVLPQLGASGVTGHEIQRRTGFRVIWGPIHARDLVRFLENPKRIDPSMRRISFTLKERMLLIPVEIVAALKPTAWAMGAVMTLALIVGLSGPGTFEAVFRCMLLGALAAGVGIVSGSVMTPILLPWLPGRAFALKGASIGLAFAAFCHMALYPTMAAGLGIALALLTIVTSSFFAMNFTGATPFTSPSGVEKEMRRAIPVQAITMIIGTLGWLNAIWTG
jgi:CO dehydrogenase/acetyl-CoA synthase delta subunit